MKNIYLIGFMGAGKSTVAKAMGRIYGMRRVEMDEQIEAEEGMAIPQIFAAKGEAYFREKETELLVRCTEKTDLVVSCGGGAAMRECNVAEMKKNGYIVWLQVSPETVYGRVKNSHHRPLLEGNMNVEYIEDLLKKREPAYERAADIVICTDGKNADAICREIMQECTE